MTKNMIQLVSIITSSVNADFSDTLPTIKQIQERAGNLRKSLENIYPVSDEEFVFVINRLESQILHSMGDTITLRGQDSEHKSWYFACDNDGYYWNRYKEYLKSVKQWGIEIISKLHRSTDETMDDLGNPRDPDRPFQRRGLLLGDVQSGKTATYTAICNKACDCGYRVIIVLAGTMENLRVQTQERLDAELVGIESKYTLDTRVENNGIRNKPVGVGKIPPANPNKRIACFTSVATDFNKNTLNSLGLSLRTMTGTALFVVKKNKSVLDNLYKWLIENNADRDTDIIDLPLLLIDDEADNASVNTSPEDCDPTAINKAITSILNCFKQASYIGITATPFANIFIDPKEEQDEGTRNLFPKDFLTVLPPKDKYIGPDKLFGQGDADSWDSLSTIRKKGEYGDSIIPILDDEQKSFFFFKHKKEIADDLNDLPASLKEAIRYFVIASAVSDNRMDKNEHRSMLVNVSRYTVVQNKVAVLITDYLNSIKDDLENYSMCNIDDAMKIKNIAMLKETWDKYNIATITRINWPTFLSEFLNIAARRIEVRSVNQSTGAKTLNYHEYRDVGFRVIAVGGNSLSRGLTLEGLCVSYFYRNTMMYDTLLQMGRWFGYRENYEDVFKIWIGEQSIDWFGFITDALNELKNELENMKRANARPEDFGLKVRQAPGTLLITARNKMRCGQSVSRPVTISGRMLETPRLKADQESLNNNETLCREFIKSISEDPDIEYKKDDFCKAHVWHNVPRKKIIELVSGFTTHPWNLNFQPVALVEYIKKYGDSLEKWDVAIPFGTSSDTMGIILKDETLSVHPEPRKMEVAQDFKNMIRVNEHHVRVGAGGCAKIGLTEAEVKEVRRNNPQPNDRDYLKVQGRKPIALIHILKKEDNKEDVPDMVFALGLGFPYDGKEKVAHYMVNPLELKNWTDPDEEDSYDGID